MCTVLCAMYAWACTVAVGVIYTIYSTYTTGENKTCSATLPAMGCNTPSFYFPPFWANIFGHFDMISFDKICKGKFLSKVKIMTNGFEIIDNFKLCYL